MKTFRITETVEYVVDADDEEEALDVFLNAEDIDTFLVGITERDVEEA